MLVVYQVLVIFKKSETYDKFTSVEARQKFNFPVQKSWFLLSTNSNCFYRKYMTPR